MQQSNTAPTLPAPATDEQQLILRLLHDDAHAWRQFSADYSRVIHRCISRVLNRFGSLTTDEDTREVYATLCVQLLSRDKCKLRSYDPERGTRLSTWLGMLATHAAYDFLRSRKRDPKTEDSDQEPPSTGAPSPFDICSVREQAAHVSELLAQFSDKDREFVELYFEQGLEPEEVADQMGISVKTVYSKKHKIRCRLLQMMDAEQLAA